MLPNFLKKTRPRSIKKHFKNEQKKKILTEQPDETQIKKKLDKETLLKKHPKS